MALEDLKGWLCDKFEIACTAPVAAKNAVDAGVHAGAEAIVDQVKDSSRMKQITIPALDGTSTAKKMNDLGI